MDEILEELEREEDPGDIIVFPPEDGNVTDEDSGDENDINMAHLPSRMLRSRVEVQPRLVEENEELEPGPSQKKKRKEYAAKEWFNNASKFSPCGRGDDEESITENLEEELSATDCFELFYSKEIVQYIVDMSNLYALQRNHTLNVSADEIRVYIGILLLTGYITPKYMRMFWENKSDTYNKLVASSMRRNRFFEIQQYLHLCDSTNLPENDKFGKVRKYFTLFNENCLAQYYRVKSSHVSIDETIIPYYGRHGTKQHIHGKPIRFGYKLWSAATRHGYLITCELYQGATGPSLKLQPTYGLGAAVVIELHSRLPPELGPYNIYFDNFFTGLPLLTYLHTNNVGGTGTIRENRLENCPLVKDVEMKKGPRGTMVFKASEKVIAVKWNDNRVVRMASNCHALTPITKVDRIGVINKKRVKIQVDCPSLVRMYNKFMGGVDRFDENVHSMRISLRGKKWWFALFAFGLDAACQNAWLVKRQKSDTWTYCNFRRAVVQVYLHKYGKPPTKNPKCGVPLGLRVPDETRLAGTSADHVEVDCPQRRCGLCHQRTRKMCLKCDVGLHVKCWYKFHNK